MAGVAGGVIVTNDAGDTWVRHGADIGGSVLSIVASPAFDSDRTAFFGTFGGGVYRSTDGGTTWVASSVGLGSDDGLVMNIVEQIAISPTFASDRVVYCTVTGIGAYRSTDGGVTWVLVDAFPQEAQGIEFSPRYASDGTIFVWTKTTLYRSTDRGTSWTALLVPHSCERMHVVTSTFDQLNQAVIYVGCDDGLYRSMDGGLAWIHMDMLPNDDMEPFVYDITVLPGSAWRAYVYARTDFGYFSSPDYGVSWNWTEIDEETGCGSGNLAVSPAFEYDWSMLLPASSGIYRTTDRAETWEHLENGTPFAHVVSLTTSPEYPADTRMLVGTWGGGSSFSTDAGAHWSGTSMRNGNFWDVALAAPAGGQQIALGANQWSPYRSTDGGQTWEYPTDTGLPWELYPLSIEMSPDFANDDTVLMGLESAGVWRSEDAGLTWTQSNDGLAEASVWYIVMSPAFADDGVAFASTEAGVFRSEDRGHSWTRCGGPAAYAEISRVTPAPDFGTSRTVYMAGNGVRRSDDAGETWYMTSVAEFPFAIDGANGSTGASGCEQVQFSSAYPADPTIYAATWGVGVHGSSDGGRTWWPIDASGMLPGQRWVNEIDVLGSGGAQRIYAATAEGVAVHAGAVTPGAAEFQLQEIQGMDRYETAEAICARAFPGPQETVIIATGATWPDALGGSALAGALGAPVLLTAPDALPTITSERLGYLRPKRAVILGGTGAVSAAVESQIASAVEGVSVERIGGANRFETAALVAKATAEALGDRFDGRVLVATGGNFPDALAASPLASAKGWPILLAEESSLGSHARGALGAISATQATVLGGTGAVSDDVASEIAGALGGASHVERVAGENRYATAVAVSAYGVSNAGLGWDGLAFATGESFPDALTGGVMQGHLRSVMLLTPRVELAPVALSTLQAHKEDIHVVTFVGGTGAVSGYVRDAVGNVFGLPPYGTAAAPRPTVPSAAGITRAEPVSDPPRPTWRTASQSP